MRCPHGTCTEIDHESKPRGGLLVCEWTGVRSVAHGGALRWPCGFSRTATGVAHERNHTYARGVRLASLALAAVTCRQPPLCVCALH